MDKIQSSIDFLIEIEHLKSVYRKAKVKSDNNRRENSAEHSWHIAIAAQMLKDFIDIDVDINKVIQMLLIHDIVEIYAGDMFAFEDKGTKKSHKLEEKKAIERLCFEFNLKQVETFKNLWLEFEDGITNESKFALSMDRILPFIQNIHNNGGSWSEFGTTKTQILNHNIVLKDISFELWTYINTQLKFAIDKGWILNE